jgi:hypothetical protein
MGTAFMLFELSTFGSAAALGAAILFALVRPRQDKTARLEHKLHVRLLEAELHDSPRCLECLTPIEPEFRCCPGCGERLRVECESCGELLALGWAVCPWCVAQTTMRRSLRPSDVAA